MLKSRRKQAEIEAKQDPEYRPTSELKAEEDKPNYEVPWTGIIIIGVLTALIVICIILIVVLGRR